MLFLIFGILFLVFLSYKFLTKDYNYWEKKGVKYVKPLPVVGNILPTLIETSTSSEFITDLYNQFPNERYSGFFEFNTPILLLKDPKLIKALTITHFANFADHVGFINIDVDPLWGKNLFASEGERWRQLRQTLTPAFSTGKMKNMFGLMEECAEQLVVHFKSQNRDVIEVEMKDVFTRFTTDVIATTAFGIKCDSLKNQDNEFLLSGRKLTNNISGLKKIFFLIIGSCPFLARFLDQKIVENSIGNFFRGIINETIALRKEKNIIRPDLIHLLMAAQKEKKKQTEDSTLQKTDGLDDSVPEEFLTNEDITAQALLFFFGGFDSSSSMLSFTSYELALNPDIQNRLRQEVLTVSQKYDNKVSYENLSELKYMDMVLSESLRKWAQTAWVDRKCTKPFVIEPENPGEKPVEINVGDTCWIPVWAIQRDPKFYPKPEIFDPERFSEENKSKIVPSTFIPFGIGPRNCIGSRFALLEAKIVLVNLLREFEIVTIAKTEIPLTISAGRFTLDAKYGFRLGLQRKT